MKMAQFHLFNEIKEKTMPGHRYRAEIRRYLFLLLIPVLLLILLYVNVNQVITRQVKEFAELNVNHFYVQSSSMLHEMQLVSNAILRDSDVTRVLKTDDDEALDSFYICDIIREGLKESHYVQHAYLVSQKTSRIYSDQGLFNSQSLPTILGKIGADYAELAKTSSEADFHVLNENRIAPYCTIPISDHDGSLIGTMFVTLNMTEFLRIFYSLDAELCTIFNDHVYISSYISNIKAEDFDWRSEASISALLGKPVTCEYLEQDDYTYLVAVSRDSYNRPLQVILKWFFIYALSALALGYCYLYQVSKRRYQHISALLKTLPVTYTGDQSYEQVYESIRKSLEDYRSQKEQLLIENREHALHMLLRSAVLPEHELPPERFRSAGIDPQNGGFYYVATFFTEISDPALAKDRTKGTAEFLHILFRSTFSKLAEQAGLSCAFCEDHGNSIVVFQGSDAAALRAKVFELGKNAIEILTNSYNMKIQVTISNPVISHQNLPAAYQETQRLRSFARSINSDAVMIAQEELLHSSSVLLNGDFIRQEQILINTILARKYDAVPSMVESILSTHISPLRKNYALAQNRLLSVSNVLAEGVRMAAIPGFEAEQHAAVIAQASSVRQLTNATAEIYGLMDAQSRAHSSESDIVDIACSYIAQNLSDWNLNVAAICEAAGVSVQRLTRMFQARFDMAVAEYMNACRIKLAKELLPDKQLTVSQIAQQVGYSNTDTFTRNFRKVEGITPSEYRKSLHAD